MNYLILTCDGYHVECSAKTLREAVGLCNDLERSSNDGFARVVTLYGSIVADAEGSRSDPERYVDAATQTGMYD
jgi:hypothetical protein